MKVRFRVEVTLDGLTTFDELENITTYARELGNPVVVTPQGGREGLVAWEVQIEKDGVFALGYAWAQAESEVRQELASRGVENFAIDLLPMEDG